jgi:methyltransferase (TIGR00027 family)
METRYAVNPDTNRHTRTNRAGLPICDPDVVRRSAPSSTAQNVALARAHLTWLGVLDDPYARTMLRPSWSWLDKALRLPVLSGLGHNRTFSWLAARTHFYDDAVTSALDAGLRQVIVVAAGYDSRAWRLARPGVRFFEVDHPATQSDKRHRAPTGGPRYVPVELGVDELYDSLLAAGFDPSEPSVFTVEGLTMYLTEAQVVELFQTLCRIGAPGSRLAVNFGLGVEAAATSTSGRAGALLTGLSLRMSGEHVMFRPSPEQAREALVATGWTPESLTTAPELIRHYLTGTPLPTNGLKPTAFTMTATMS